MQFNTVETEDKISVPGFLVRICLILVSLSLFPAWTLPISAQEAIADEAKEDDHDPLDAEQQAAGGDPFPDLNLYLPEGEFDIRLRKLVKNVLFEGQVNYNFVDGDVTTFLRYKYYARRYAYKIGVFDSISFESIDSGTGDFDRTRGALLLFDVPREYNRRYVFLLQSDSLSFGDVTDVDHDHDNFYFKAGYQVGTPLDQRLNAIAGESRGRITPVLTAHREIGQAGFGAAIAVTQGLGSIGGEYEYTKLEAEGLKRYNFGETFLISRLGVGSILLKDRIPGREEHELKEQFSVPEYELFKIGDRNGLKGFDDHLKGTEAIFLSNEYFYPLFRDRDFVTWRLHWRNLYAIGYAGAGSLGFDQEIYTDFDRYAVDAGLGFEAGLTFRDYEIFLTAVYARTVAGPAEFENDEFRFSARTRR